MIFDYIKERMEETNGFNISLKHDDINIFISFNKAWYEKGMCLLHASNETENLICCQPLVSLNESKLVFDERYNINGGNVDYFKQRLFPQPTELQILNGQEPDRKFWYDLDIAIIGRYQTNVDKIQELKQKILETSQPVSFIETEDIFYLDQIDESKMMTNAWKIQLNYDFGIPLNLLDDIQTLASTITISKNKSDCIEHWLTGQLSGLTQISRPQEIIDQYPAQEEPATPDVSEIEASEEIYDTTYEQPQNETYQESYTEEYQGEVDSQVQEEAPIEETPKIQEDNSVELSTDIQE